MDEEVYTLETPGRPNRELDTPTSEYEGHY